MRKIIQIAFCLFVAVPALAQHSMLTSNYLFNLFAVNPAYAGQKGALDATVYYRKQWATFNGTPENYGVMAHLEIKPKNFGVGIQVENEKISLFTNTKVSAAFSYKLKFDKKNTLSFGVSPGLMRSVTNYDKLITTQSGDGAFNDYLYTKNSFVTGAGLFFANPKFYAGFSVPDMMQLNTPEKLMEYNFIAGYVYKVNDNLSIKPSTLVRAITNSPTQFDASVAAYLQQMFGIGLSYRNKEAIIIYSELLIKKQFKIGYAYDASIGGLRKYNSGSHEIMLNYFFGKTTNVASPRFF